MKSLFENNEVAFNLALFKKLHLHRLLDPNCTKIFNLQIYRLALVILIIIGLCITIFGLMGFFTKMEDNVDNIGLFLIGFSLLQSFQAVLKLSICVYKANKIWDLLDITCFNFLKSKQCIKHIIILHKYCDMSKKLTNFLSISFIGSISLWLTYPLLFNMFILTSADRKTRRYENFINLRFPVSIKMYNTHYYIFYLMEAEIGFLATYGAVMIDVFLISIYCVIIAQYKILAKAFEKIGHQIKFQNSKQEKMNFELLIISKFKN